MRILILKLFLLYSFSLLAEQGMFLNNAPTDQAYYLRQQQSYFNGGEPIGSRKYEIMAQQQRITVLEACTRAEISCQDILSSKLICEQNTDGTISCNGKVYSEAKEVNNSSINSIKEISPTQVDNSPKNGSRAVIEK